jgi:L,D-transpeptidase ErfK/SrfK
MHPEDAGALFRQVKVGEPGEIIYEPLLLAKLEDGRIFVEAHRDPYRKKNREALRFLRRMAAANNLDKVIDWKRAAEVTSRNKAVARQVSANAN